MRALPSEETTPEAEAAADPPEQPAGRCPAEAIFCDLWAKAHGGEPYSLSPDTGPRGDVSQLVVAWRRSVTEWPRDPEAHFRHKVAGYLRDKGTRGFLDDKRHPARLLQQDWQAYGVPKAKRPTAPQTPAEPEAAPVATEESAARGRAIVAQLSAGFGKGPMSASEAK